MDNAITSSFAFEGGVSNNLLVMGRTVIFMMKLRWQPKKNLYIFIDEGGDMVFSEKGTRYFTLTALTKTRPFTTHQTLTELKYDLWEKILISNIFMQPKIHRLLETKFLMLSPKILINSLLIP